MVMSGLRRLADVLGDGGGENAAPIPWDTARAEVGFDFPADYREFVERYGSVEFNSEFYTVIPTDGSPRRDWPTGFAGFTEFTVRNIGERMRWSRIHDKWNPCPYPVYPEAGGLLAWAKNDESDHIFWIMEGDDPDAWPQAVWFRQLDRWERFEGGMTDFLVAALDGTFPRGDELGIAPYPGKAFSWRRIGGYWEGSTG